jgi:hypothetical protein
MSRVLSTSSPAAGAVLLAGLLAGLTGCAQVPAPAGGSAPDPSGTPPGIVAHGEGTVTGTPDTLTLVLGVQTQAPSARGALDANTTRADAVIGMLKGRGVAAKDLRTSELSISPMYGGLGGDRITGYQVSNQVTATLHSATGQNAASAGGIIDAAAAAAGDAVRVRQVSFSIADDSALRAQARAAAVRQAKERAQQMAEAAGVSLGSLRSLTEGTSSTPQMPFGAQRAGSDAAVPIEPGSQELQVTVDAVYTIDQ